MAHPGVEGVAAVLQLSWLLQQIAQSRKSAFLRGVGQAKADVPLQCRKVLYAPWPSQGQHPHNMLCTKVAAGSATWRPQYSFAPASDREAAEWQRMVH